MEVEKKHEEEEPKVESKEEAEKKEQKKEKKKSDAPKVYDPFPKKNIKDFVNKSKKDSKNNFGLKMSDDAHIIFKKLLRRRLKAIVEEAENLRKNAKQKTLMENHIIRSSTVTIPTQCGNLRAKTRSYIKSFFPEDDEDADKKKSKDEEDDEDDYIVEDDEDEEEAEKDKDKDEDDDEEDEAEAKDDDDDEKDSMKE